MLDFKAWKEKLKRDPKRMLMNMMIIFLFGVLLILISDISSSLIGKDTREGTNSMEVTSGTISNTEKDGATDIRNGVGDYKEKTKEELLATLAEIDGVGRVSVMINYDGGENSVPAFNETNSSKRIEEKDSEGGLRVTTENSKNQEVVMVSGSSGNKPLVVKQYNPRISGVVVVAEGAGNPVVKERLYQTVRTVLNLLGAKVSVMPMKKNN